ncbi:hypothetical protein HQ584_07600 [Patescibacteria group bacterium]|nr:hypothetical protein [Patescibacteria group bacterium]
MKKVFERFEVTNFVGTGVFIRRNAFQDVGGYFYIDPCGGKEETDLSLRFIKRGYKIYYAGDMTVYHGLDQPNPFHFNWKSKYRAGLSNSFIIAARYLPFPYFLTYTFIWTLYYLYQYHKKKLLIHFGKDFTYALQNFIQIWRSERSKHKLDKITVNKIRRLKGRLAY